MKRLMAIALLSLVLGASPPARSETRTWIGIATSLQSGPKPMLGDAREIVDGLGLKPVDDPVARIAPRAWTAFEVVADRGKSIAVLAELSWFSDSIDATGAVSYRARRDVIPLNALFRLTVGAVRTRLLLEAGPTLAMTRFAESGWLGDGEQTRLAPGLFFLAGGRSMLGSDFGVVNGVSGQWLYLPRNSALLADGGSSLSYGLTLGFEYGP